jgi:hypothetical protein
VRTITISKRLSVPALLSTQEEKQKKLLSVTVSKTLTKKLDISERLNLARQEAILERKMDQLKDDLLKQAKQETIDKTMKFLKKLPEISNGTEQSETGFQRSSSIPIMSRHNSGLRQNSGFSRDEDTVQDSLLNKVVVSCHFFKSFSDFGLSKDLRYGQHLLNSKMKMNFERSERKQKLRGGVGCRRSKILMGSRKRLTTNIFFVHDGVFVFL